MNNTLKIAVAAAAGVVAGAALGILFAPEKGSALRKKIADKGKQIIDNVKDRFECVNDKERAKEFA